MFNIIWLGDHREAGVVQIVYCPERIAEPLLQRKKVGVLVEKPDALPAAEEQFEDILEPDAPGVDDQEEGDPEERGPEGDPGEDWDPKGVDEEDDLTKGKDVTGQVQKPITHSWIIWGYSEKNIVTGQLPKLLWKVPSVGVVWQKRKKLAFIGRHVNSKKEKQGGMQEGGAQEEVGEEGGKEEGVEENVENLEEGLNDDPRVVNEKVVF